jgi:glycine/D-amino acid oxidase-like deaminating enzyme
MFPAWSEVDLTHYWSGLVCLSESRFPFVGPVPDQPGLYGSFCYHGNGVAMGSYCGHLIAGELLEEETPDVVRRILSRPPKSFPFGRFRRIGMPITYAALALGDL